MQRLPKEVVIAEINSATVLTVRYLREDGGGNPSTDVGLVKLRQPLDKKRFPPATIDYDWHRADDPKESRYLTGYPGTNLTGFTEVEASTEKCEVSQPSILDGDGEHRFLTINCFGVSGLSGAPFYALHNGQVVIYGVLSGAEHDYGTTAIAFSESHANRAADVRIVQQLFEQFNGMFH